MAILNITYQGQSADYELALDFAASDADIRRIAVEVVRSGGVRGLHVAQLPDHLEDGGYGTIMISWVADEDASSRPASWISGRGCDAWLLHTATEDPLQSALAWNKASGVEPDALKERIDAWLEYFERLGIERVAYGAMIVRRRFRFWAHDDHEEEEHADH